MKIYFYYYDKIKVPKRRDVNAVVTVYEQRRGGYFSHIGYKLVDSKGYPGVEETTYQILHEHFNYRWKKGKEGREFVRKDIRLISLPIGIQDYHLTEEDSKCHN